MGSPKVAVMSLWRNDEHRSILDRMNHLTKKSYPNRRYIWVYGDCTDDTQSFLRLYADLAKLEQGIEVQLVQHDTGIQGESKRVVDANRLTRLSQTANAGLAAVRDDDDFLMIHESDLLTPPDLIERFLDNAAQGRCPVAGWPVLNVSGRTLFYDTWAYQDMHGRYFTNAEQRPDRPFQLLKFGSVAMMHGEDARAIRMTDGAFREICEKLVERGRSLWCDPTVTVEQPVSLW